MNEFIRILHPTNPFPALSPWLLSMHWAYMTPPLMMMNLIMYTILKGSKATGLSHNLE